MGVSDGGNNDGLRVDDNWMMIDDGIDDEMMKGMMMGIDDGIDDGRLDL